MNQFEQFDKEGKEGFIDIFYKDREDFSDYELEILEKEYGDLSVLKGNKTKNELIEYAEKWRLIVNEIARRDTNFNSTEFS